MMLSELALCLIAMCMVMAFAALQGRPAQKNVRAEEEADHEMDAEISIR